MSGLYWWALASLGLIGVVAVPVGRWVARKARAGRAAGDEALVDWIIALREAEGAPTVEAPVVRPARRGCAARGRTVAPLATGAPMAATRPPQWRGSRRPPSSGRMLPASPGFDLRRPDPAPGFDLRRPGLAPGNTEPGPRLSLPTGKASTWSSPTGAARWSSGLRRNLMLLLLLGTGVSGLLAGPVAAVACGGYGALGLRALHRRAAAVHQIRMRRERLDQLCALAADLRAGLPVLVAAEALGLSRSVPAPIARSVPAQMGESASPVAGAGGRPETPRRAGGPGQPARRDTAEPEEDTSGERFGLGHRTLPDRPGQLAQAAVRLAERTGAPLADLIERIEADARSIDRGVAAAAAQAAGARATAWLLAALPLGGVGLGYGIGVDPLEVLLHTWIGGGCGVAAVALQVVGLVWADRLGAVADGGV